MGTLDFLSSEERAAYEKEAAEKRKKMFPAIAGRTLRKLKRACTIHTKGTCPVCGHSMKFHKYLDIKGGKREHDVYLCPKCNKVYHAGDEKVKVVFD